MCTKFGVDNLSRCFFRAWTHKLTKSQTPLITWPLIIILSRVCVKLYIVMDKAVGCYAYGNMFCWL